LQYGHWRSANSIMVTGAFGSPSWFSCCGMPAKSAVVAAAPDSVSGSAGSGDGAVVVFSTVVVMVAVLDFESLEPSTLTRINATATQAARAPTPTNSTLRFFRRSLIGPGNPG